MNFELRKLFLSELRMVVFQQGNTEQITDRKMVMAMTVNENLKSIGFTLNPVDIVRLAVSPSLEKFFDSIKELVPNIDAEPMYPDFPEQVMKLSEAEFRLHQAIHYFSTYGLESLLGGKVKKGWLPDVTSTPKTESDKILLAEKVLLLEEKERAYEIALSTILGRRERMTIPEQRIVFQVIGRVSHEFLRELQIPFKENLKLLIRYIFAHTKREECILILFTICQHTGDVLKAIDELMVEQKYHFRTSQKKTLVRLLEQFPVADFRGNLILSRKNRERNLLVLQHLDYNIYSRSVEHKKVVDDLRDGKLQSWEGYAKQMLQEKREGALDVVAKRPGMMVRMINWLLNLGYSKEEISERLCANAASLSTQTLVKMLRLFRDSRVEDYILERQGKLDGIQLLYKQKRERWSLKNLESQRERESLCEKNRLEWILYDKINFLMQERNEKLQSCQKEELERAKALEIKEVEKSYMDEVHFYTMRHQKKIQELESIQKKLLQEMGKFEKKGISKEAILDSYRMYLSSYNKTSDVSWNEEEKLEKLKHKLDHVKKKISSLKEEIESIRKSLMEENEEFCEKILCIEQKYKAMENEIPMQIAKIHKNFEEQRDAASKFNEKLKEERILQIQRKNEKLLSRRERQLLFLEKEEKEKKEQVLSSYERKIKMFHNTPVKREIIKEALRSHLSYITTKLQNKKIYFDLEEYDLAHSTIETNDKSKDGGYTRSGIAYKIPEQAKRIRFFVYWNDDSRVDIDLHAGGFDIDGDEINIGWNNGFRDRGVVFSGDITHSNAVEYIDIDMSASIREIYANIHLFSGKYNFEDVRECYVGVMAVQDTKKTTKLYHPANCFITHEIRQKGRSFYYGYIDVQNHYIKFIGEPNEGSWISGKLKDNPNDMFSVEEYLTYLLEGQNATRVEKIEEADIVLSMGKNVRENGLSLIDENFFLDAV